MEKENIKRLMEGMENIAKNHNTEVIDHTTDDEEPYIGVLKCNVPTLTDVRMLCEEVGVPRENIENNDSWGYIAVYV